MSTSITRPRTETKPETKPAQPTQALPAAASLGDASIAGTATAKAGVSGGGLRSVGVPATLLFLIFVLRGCN